MKTRKELKEDYKNIKFKIGVFKLTNIANGKLFIGSSMDLEANWRSLKFQLELGSYPTNNELMNDWKKYGADNFQYEILDEIEQNDEKKNINYLNEVKELEKLFIEELQPFEEKGYNKRKKK